MCVRLDRYIQGLYLVQHILSINNVSIMAVLNYLHMVSDFHN